MPKRQDHSTEKTERLSAQMQERRDVSQISSSPTLKGKAVEQTKALSIEELQRSWRESRSSLTSHPKQSRSTPPLAPPQLQESWSQFKGNQDRDLGLQSSSPKGLIPSNPKKWPTYLTYVFTSNSLTLLAKAFRNALLT